MPTATVDRLTTFYAIGDVPYNQKQTAQIRVQLANIPADAEFVIHVGDLRNADNNDTCILEEYTNASSLFQLSHAPVFIVMGDNDYNDCPNLEDGWKYWHSEFANFESRYWKHNFNIQHHPNRTENFAFVHKQTLFMGLTIVGGHNRPAMNNSARLLDEVEWAKQLIRNYNANRTDIGRVVIFGHANPTRMHKDFFEPLMQFIEWEVGNQLPILYLNGDKHEWAYNPNFMNQPNLLRIMVTGGGDEPPLKVMVNATGLAVNTSEAFVYDRQLKPNATNVTKNKTG